MGMPYGFVRIVYFNFIFSCFLFFRRQGFRLITFDRQGGPLQNFCRSRVMVKGGSVSFSVCVCGFFGREGGRGIPLRHGHKESYKDLNLKNSPLSGTRTTDLMNTRLYQLSYQI